ncbi:MAG: chromate transporter [Firmicutes bacterium]|nr:chromate transporter [Bacillota bacterium]
MILLELFLSFFKIGLFTIGGGYAMLALIQKEIVHYGWMTSHEFVDIVGIAEMTPGPIAINAATFIGFRSAGVTGSLIATLAVILPSFISVLAVSRFWGRYKDFSKVQAVFGGVRPAVAGLIMTAAVLLGLASFQAVEAGFRLRTVLIAAAVFFLIHFRKLDPIKVLLICALIGLFVFK